jgi:hypothetical protein
LEQTPDFIQWFGVYEIKLKRKQMYCSHRPKTSSSSN